MQRGCKAFGSVVELGCKAFGTVVELGCKAFGTVMQLCCKAFGTVMELGCKAFGIVVGTDLLSSLCRTGPNMSSEAQQTKFCLLLGKYLYSPRASFEKNQIKMRPKAES